MLLRRRCSMMDRQSPDASTPGADQLGNPSHLAVDELPMNLLAAGIPLTLLLDLAENFGPPSAQILAAEHEADHSDPSEAALIRQVRSALLADRGARRRHPDGVAARTL
jgi:hypothetical protein